MVSDRDQGRPLEFGGQHLEQDVRSGAQQNLDGGWNTGSLPPVATFRG